MLIDTHCHLDAGEFDHDRDQVAKASLDADVRLIVVPAVERSNFGTVSQLAERHPHCAYALGIHPLFVPDAKEEDLGYLRTAIEQGNPVAVGEIGLDFFVEGYDRERQEYFFIEQLKLAREFELPVILHVRRSVDDVLKYLRRIKVSGGIAHAFNGSRQQADAFIKLGFKLGFGGAMTYPRALKIRDLAIHLPLEAIVLETDSPDIPPEWLGHHGRNSPYELPKIAQVLADLRQINLTQVADTTTKNALNALPKLAQLCTPPHVLL
ncbi:DNAase [Methylovorus sp. MM2]|uniref:TatD family hydrolase n=1 Tax=Methylovorus sp. MM2 TaxID=1848038 RepID=UPI0007E20027|nr:TatD family hydrolase [Methylovorus sp. MM2]OAM51330.1 DNAase [Methylovorus sp. MM2]